MRFVPFVVIVAALVVGVASPSWAITNGSPDESGHPEVGALIADKQNDDGTWSYCTGTLISPTVFLTAAHCGARRQKTARVSFASHYEPGAPVYTGRYVADPLYTDEADAHDMAVVIFSTAVSGIKPATLPVAGMLDGLEANGTLETTRFTPVGYGSLAPTKGGRGNEFTYTDTRNLTSISFKTLTRKWLELNLHEGDGGTCYGDSGGPNFLGGPTSHLLVATTISGDDDACKSTNYDYRLDTASARDFLGRFVTLP
ncbi:trypsin-like serine protease [Planotetraspora sp. A-T 1434]|uniref:S1 family peptidase n=1 Tax=Planotetraspora sp. A-T 1434 TaxID=2979219 RepID=UPI0021C0091B|nr:trypsin-like serine protease [Planotetraspora sp. A-T 1434]MCT9929873.1 trypsin-like serine protease [Planotetraspora sp. A-T 1434]